MLFTTPTQFAVLALLLVVGWLFGFASHSGGKRWRAAYDEEAVGRAQDREELDAQLRQVDGRIAELERENAALKSQIVETERERDEARGRQSSPVAPALAGAAMGAVAASAARPAFAREPEPAAATPALAPEPVARPAPAEPAAGRLAFARDHAPAPVAVEPAPAVEPDPVPAPAPEPVKRGWFDWGKTDDLTRLRGIDGELETRLKAEKVDTYRELANLSDQDELALERRLDLPAGYIQREQLREQAQLLVAGDIDGHVQRFG